MREEFKCEWERFEESCKQAEFFFLICVILGLSLAGLGIAGILGLI